MSTLLCAPLFSIQGPYRYATQWRRDGTLAAMLRRSRTGAAARHRRSSAARVTVPVWVRGLFPDDRPLVRATSCWWGGRRDSIDIRIPRRCRHGFVLYTYIATLAYEKYHSLMGRNAFCAPV